MNVEIIEVGNPHFTGYRHSFEIASFAAFREAMQFAWSVAGRRKELRVLFLLKPIADLTKEDVLWLYDQVGHPYGCFVYSDADNINSVNIEPFRTFNGNLFITEDFYPAEIGRLLTFYDKMLAANRAMMQSRFDVEAPDDDSDDPFAEELEAPQRR